VMTLLAQALKRAKPELVDVAVMWLDVIADRRRCDDAARNTYTAGAWAAGAFGFEPSEPWSTTYPTFFAGREHPSLNLSSAGPCTKHSAAPEGAMGRAYASRYDARVESEMLSTDFRREG